MYFGLFSNSQLLFFCTCCYPQSGKSWGFFLFWHIVSIWLRSEFVFGPRSKCSEVTFLYSFFLFLFGGLFLGMGLNLQ
jgi:hypothetical protein